MRKGFTLVEALVVFGIIGILIAMLILAIHQVQEAAKKTQEVRQKQTIESREYWVNGLGYVYIFEVEGSKFIDSSNGLSIFPINKLAEEE